MDGISSDDITLQVSAASVSVVATIAAPSEATGNAALITLQSLAASPEALTTALGVPVETVDAAPQLVVAAQSVGDVDTSDGNMGLIAASIGAVGAAILLLFALFVRCRRRAVARLRQPSLQAIDAQSVEIDVESATLSERDANVANSCKGSTSADSSTSHSTMKGIEASPSVRVQRAFQDMAQWEWASADVTWEEQLGSGSFGVVHRIKYNNATLAAKRMDVNKKSGSRAETEAVLAREFRALQRALHDNIVQLLAVVVDHPDWICLVMELADRGTLRQMLEDSPQQVVGKLPVQIGLAHDVACALAFCHSLKPKPILHHDIKSANILLFSQDNSGAARLTAKLADFGLAIGLSGTSTAAATQATGTHAAGGTMAYRAPETFGGSYTTASEVYSFSIVLWELLTGEKPWNRDAEGRPYMEVTVMHLVAQKGKRPTLPSNSALMTQSRSLVTLMNRCWSQQPKRRPNFETIVGQLKPQLSRLASSGQKKIALALDEISSIKASMDTLHAKVDKVDDNVNRVHSGVANISFQLDAMEERLAREMREGNAALMQQVRLLHSSLLPEIQSVIAQQTLELLAMQQVARVSDSASGGSGGILNWLFATREEEETRLLEIERNVKAAIDMADSKLRASAQSVAAQAAAAASSASMSASADILKKLDEMQSALGSERDPSGGTRGEAMLSKLEDISAYMSQVDSSMTRMRLEADDRAKEQAQQLALIHAKLDTLLTGSNEQVFHHFILVPKPQKGYVGRALVTLKPRYWFSKPMLLIPLYRSPSGELKRAPVKVASGGFEVPRPMSLCSNILEQSNWLCSSSRRASRLAQRSLEWQFPQNRCTC